MKILIAEDDTFFQKFYSAKLQEKGFEIVVAVDGEEAIQKVTEVKPDLVLLDIIMPKKDGFEVLAALKSSDATKSIPVIVFSSLGQEQDVKKALQLGALDYVNKGFYNIDLLFEKIAKFIKS